MNHYKYLIIGQGLAGTMLSMRLHEKGLSHYVIDQPGLSLSSKIAAGLANPIVLKRLKWVKDAEHFLPPLQEFYQYWEKKLATQFFHPTVLHHVFNSNGEVNEWLEKSTLPYFDNHLGAVYRDSPPNINLPFGYGSLENIFWVNTAGLITSYRNFLSSNDQYEERDLEISDGTIHNLPKQMSFDKVVLSSGHLARKQFPKLESIFTPTKGEVMIIEAPELRPQHAWHKGVFALPLGNQLFKVGATYGHLSLEDQTTSQGLEKLRQEFEKIYTGPYRVVEHQAGVRPNIKDRKPLLGSLSEQTDIFNGLGSRGVLMAPFLANTMVNYLEGQEEIPAHWNVNRFTLS